MPEHLLSEDENFAQAMKKIQVFSDYLDTSQGREEMVQRFRQNCNESFEDECLIPNPMNFCTPEQARYGTFAVPESPSYQIGIKRHFMRKHQVTESQAEILAIKAIQCQQKRGRIILEDAYGKTEENV